MKQFISKKQMGKIIMPEVGTILDDKYKVIYTNPGQFRLTAKGNDMPEMSRIFDLDGRKFKVTSQNLEFNRFSADFVGYDDPKVIPDAPQQEKEEVVSLLDD